MEDDLWWKMTIDERHPLMEDNILWKTTFDGRQPLMENNLGGNLNPLLSIQTKLLNLSLFGSQCFCSIFHPRIQAIKEKVSGGGAVTKDLKVYI